MKLVIGSIFIGFAAYYLDGFRLSQFNWPRFGGILGCAALWASIVFLAPLVVRWIAAVTS